MPLVNPVLILSYNDDGTWNWVTTVLDIRHNRQEPISSGKEGYFTGTKIDEDDIILINNPTGRSGIHTNSVVFLGKLI